MNFPNGQHSRIKAAAVSAAAPDLAAAAVAVAAADGLIDCLKQLADIVWLAYCYLWSWSMDRGQKHMRRCHRAASAHVDNQRGAKVDNDAVAQKL